MIWNNKSTFTSCANKDSFPKSGHIFERLWYDECHNDKLNSLIFLSSKLDFFTNTTTDKVCVNLVLKLFNIIEYSVHCVVFKMFTPFRS